MTYIVTAVKALPDLPNVPADVLLADADIAKSSAELAAALPGEWPPGTLIHSAGYKVIKEKALDGSWVEL